MRYFREERGLTQADVARLAKIGVATMGRMEQRGPRNPRLYARVCRVMMVTPKEVDAWIAARTIDPRLLPLVWWFASLAPNLKDALGALLRLLPRESGR